MNKYDGILNGIRALAKGGQTDVDIAELLYNHKCFYLLSRLKTGHGHSGKPGIENPLNRICIDERYRSCRPVFEAFERNNIPYAVIKGAVLSNAAYGGPYCRHSGDIDLLVCRDEIDRIKGIMLDQGFIQGRVTSDGIERFSRRELLFQSAMSHQAAPFIKETGNPLCPYINVDINMDILWGESKRTTDMAFVLQDRLQVSMCGGAIWKLSGEMEFAALCLHHYKDMNSLYLLSQGSLKLGLLCDIYFYLKNNALNIDKLRAICGRLDVSEYLYYCVYYADQIFDDILLNSYLSAFQTPKARSMLDRFGLAEDEFYHWEIEFFDRLFIASMDDYLKTRLSHKSLEKISVNKMLM